MLVMAGGSGYSKEDIVDEINEEAKNIMDKIINDVGKASAMKQLLFGGTAGWITGFALMKVGKAAAATIGSGVLLLQVASYNGYIKINWDKLTKKADELADQLDNSDSAKKPNILKKMIYIMSQNSPLAGGFTGGFLLGISAS